MKNSGSPLSEITDNIVGFVVALAFPISSFFLFKPFLYLIGYEPNYRTCVFDCQTPYYSNGWVSITQNFGIFLLWFFLAFFAGLLLATGVHYLLLRYPSEITTGFFSTWVPTILYSGLLGYQFIRNQEIPFWVDFENFNTQNFLIIRFLIFVTLVTLRYLCKSPRSTPSDLIYEVIVASKASIVPSMSFFLFVSYILNVPFLSRIMIVNYYLEFDYTGFQPVFNPNLPSEVPEAVLLLIPTSILVLGIIFLYSLVVDLVLWNKSKRQNTSKSENLVFSPSLNPLRNKYQISSIGLVILVLSITVLGIFSVQRIANSPEYRFIFDLTGQGFIFNNPFYLNLTNVNARPSFDFPLGTDEYGRDMLSHLTYASIVLVSVSLVFALSRSLMVFVLTFLSTRLSQETTVNRVIRFVSIQLSKVPIFLTAIYMALLYLVIFGVILGIPIVNYEQSFNGEALYIGMNVVDFLIYIVLILLISGIFGIRDFGSLEMYRLTSMPQESNWLLVLTRIFQYVLVELAISSYFISFDQLFITPSSVISRTISSSFVFVSSITHTYDFSLLFIVVLVLIFALPRIRFELPKTNSQVENNLSKEVMFPGADSAEEF